MEELSTRTRTYNLVGVGRWAMALVAVVRGADTGEAHQPQAEIRRLTPESPMTLFIEKFRKIEKEVAAERGDLVLFALVEREGHEGA